MVDRMIRRRSLLLAGAVLLPAEAGIAQPGRGSSAPEFVGIDGWVNSAGPITVAGLRGKVVLVDFWTYSCINCRRTVGYLNRWQATYGRLGLQVVGIHTPEFGFERMRHNVEESVRAFGIRYPVGQDNGFETWRAWRNRAWPTFYLLDRDGRLVLVREGEGHARELESAIRALLGLPPSGTVGQPGDDPDLSRIGTQEIYFGSQHGTRQDREQGPREGLAAYSFRAEGPRLDEYQLDGTWLRDTEVLQLRSPHGGLRVRFSAAKLHLVAAAPEGTAVRVRVDAGAPQTVEVERPTLYTLFDGETYGEHLLELETPLAGLQLFSATFG